MARIVKPLTNTEVKNTKAKDKEFNLADGEGLSLRVKPNGSKNWIFNYTHPVSNKRANIGFGIYPEVTLAIARDKRLNARSLLAKDIDPKTHKAEAIKQKKEVLSNTFINVASNWFEVKKTSVSQDYGLDVWRSLELHILPSIGKYPLTEITAPLVISIMKPIAAKGSLETVKRLSQRLNEIMTYAVNTGLIHANPLSGIKAAFEKPKKQNMPTLAADQLPELMAALSRASIKIVTRTLIEWQLHTMTRPGEAAATKWNEIDFENKLWNIPAERMKKKRPHTIPLSVQALGLLSSIKPISGHREYVFPADRSPRDHANKETANAALKRMGFKGILVAHGMRALASTTLNEQGFDPDVIESALAHVDKNEVRRAYNRAEYIERRKDMMTWWSQHIETAATGNMSLANKLSVHS
jgi:integrase